MEYSKKQELKEIAKEAESWIKDFEKDQPKNLEIDYDTFEGSAYLILSKIIKLSK
jgi:hypothetical protein